MGILLGFYMKAFLLSSVLYEKCVGPAYGGHISKERLFLSVIFPENCWWKNLLIGVMSKGASKKASLRTYMIPRSREGRFLLDLQLLDRFGRKGRAREVLDRTLLKGTVLDLMGRPAPIW